MSSYGARHRVNYISDSILKVLEVALILHSFQLKTLRLREFGCLVHGPGSANGRQTLRSCPHCSSGGQPQVPWDPCQDFKSTAAFKLIIA